ncbi:MAG: aa3-type cytochrome c oxidase subunit IV [Bauldia sp.]|nr:aa3-type cytochrome c oxidase subunit IV [Bauldia sp.]MCW5717630.1 aa3-type cytochrome c oxidase subunit IV [Bauldia sp.]
MAKEIEISTASAADIAADVESHRRAYNGFLRLMTWAAAGVAVVLVIVFLILN